MRRSRSLGFPDLWPLGSSRLASNLKFAFSNKKIETPLAGDEASNLNAPVLNFFFWAAPASRSTPHKDFGTYYRKIHRLILNTSAHQTWSVITWTLSFTLFLLWFPLTNTRICECLSCCIFVFVLYSFTIVSSFAVNIFSFFFPNKNFTFVHILFLETVWRLMDLVSSLLCKCPFHKTFLYTKNPSWFWKYRSCLKKHDLNHREWSNWHFSKG